MNFVKCEIAWAELIGPVQQSALPSIGIARLERKPIKIDHSAELDGSFETKATDAAMRMNVGFEADGTILRL